MDTAPAAPALGVALVNQLPAILTALAALAAAVFSLRNGKKTDKVDAKTDAIVVKADAAAVSAEVAAVKADAAAAKANEVHDTTREIAANTNGHLSRLADDNARLSLINEGLQATIITLTSVLNTRQIRRTDLVANLRPDGGPDDRQPPPHS